MAIYAVQGLYAAGCLAMAYPLYRWVLNPSFLANHQVLTDGTIKGSFSSQARDEIDEFVKSERKQKHTREEINEFINSQAKIGVRTKIQIVTVVDAIVNKTLPQDEFDKFKESQVSGALTGSEIKGFVKSQAWKMVNKEIVVIQGQGNGYSSYGNTWFSGKVGIELPKKFGDASWQFKITHQIAHIQANDSLIIFGAVLAAALFTTFVLAVNRDLFTGYLGGMGAGLITGAVLRRRAERKADQEAIGYCTPDVDRAYLNGLLKRKENGYGRDLSSWIFWPIEPSLDEKIGYFQAEFRKLGLS